MTNTDKAATFITETFPESNEMPKLGDMLQQSGLLYFNRRFIGPPAKVYWDEEKEAVGT
jgi:hypothetical protein